MWCVQRGKNKTTYILYLASSLVFFLSFKPQQMSVSLTQLFKPKISVSYLSLCLPLSLSFIHWQILLILHLKSFSFWQPLQHMEVPRLGTESELQLQAYTTATTTLELSHICSLFCSNIRSLSHWAGEGLNTYPQGHYVGFLTCWATMGTLKIFFSVCNR